MTKNVFALAAIGAFLTTATSADASGRDCPKGAQWDTSEGSCVAVKKAKRQSPEKAYQAGLKDLDEGEKKANPKRGVSKLKSACNRNHGGACYTLGYVHRNGRVVAASPTDSLRFFKKACELKIAKGCIGAARVHSDGLLTKNSEHGKALPYLQRACELGSGRGCFDLAEKYQKALGTKRDAKKAKRANRTGFGFLQKTCSSSPKDCEVLGLAYYNGRGTAKDPAKAFLAWRTGCEGGAGESCRLVATAHRYGIGTKIDTLRARRFYDRACSKYDNAWACYTVGFMMLGWKKAAQDPAALRNYAVRACRLDKRRCALRGQLYTTGVAVNKDERLASKYFLEACEAGQAESCAISGHRSADGTGVPKNAARAAEYFERACEMSWAKACRALGNAHKNGTGVKKNLDRALKKYSLACIRDDGHGCLLAGDLVENQDVKSKVAAETFYQLACAEDVGAGCRRQALIYEKAPDDKKKPGSEIAALFEKGCGFGDGESCESAGDRYYFGTRIAVNKSKAARLFASACKHGEEKPCYWVDQALREGKANEQDRKAALATVLAACNDKSVTEACEVLGQAWIVGGYLDKKQVARGVKLFRKRCDAGDRRACLQVAVLYELGTGVPKDAKKAEDTYRRECERDTLGACNRLGLMQWHRGDYEDALTLFHRACEEGDGSACNVEAFAYYTAKGRRWDTAKGAELYQKACELGFPMACSNVGELYRLGVVLKKDAEKSLEASEKGCTPAEPSGCTWVGRAYHLGEGVKADRERAEREYLRTCNDEASASADSCLFLADLYEQGSKASPSRIASLRQQAFQLAVKNTESSGYYHHLLGVLHKEGIATVADSKKALAQWRAGCEAYDPQSCLAGGRLLLRGGEGIETDRAQAQFMLERACAAAIAGGCELSEEAKKPASAGPLPAAVGGKKGCGGCGIESDPGGWQWLALVGLVALARRRRKQSE